MELNKIYNEDCLEGMAKIPDGSIDAVITDPPYCLGISSNSVRSSVDDFSLLIPFFNELFREISRVLKPEKYCYVFCDWRSYPHFYKPFNRFLKQRNLIIWNKNILNSGSWYRPTHELIMFGTNGKSKRRFSASAPDYKNFPAIAAVNRIHQSQKNLELIKELIVESTDEGETVLDPFSGSGTTAVACYELQRNYLAFEIDPQYYKISLNRVEKVHQKIFLDQRGE